MRAMTGRRIEKDRSHMLGAPRASSPPRSPLLPSRLSLRRRRVLTTISWQPTSSEGRFGCHSYTKVGLNKSIIIDLPRDARDILVSNPVIADAVIRTPRRIYVTGVAVGQSNVIIFDRAGDQILSLERGRARQLDARPHAQPPDAGCGHRRRDRER